MVQTSTLPMFPCSCATHAAPTLDFDPNKVVTVVANNGKTGESHEFSYTHAKVIGNGSFGVVFAARVVATGEMVAMKKVLQDRRFKVGPTADAYHHHHHPDRTPAADTEWTRRTEVLSQDRVVTVLGAGALGSRVAGLLAAVGFQTRVWSRSGRAVEGAEAYAGPMGLEEATTGADAVVNLLPLTEETRDVLNADLFARMNKGGFVASAGRGQHLVDADLIAALDSGQLSAAALDVFRTEPLPPEDPLWTHPGVLVTPHVAAPTQAGSAVRLMAADIRRHQRGRGLLRGPGRREKLILE